MLYYRSTIDSYSGISPDLMAIDAKHLRRNLGIVSKESVTIPAFHEENEVRILLLEGKNLLLEGRWVSRRRLRLFGHFITCGVVRRCKTDAGQRIRRSVLCPFTALEKANPEPDLITDLVLLRVLSSVSGIQLPPLAGGNLSPATAAVRRTWLLILWKKV